MRMYAIALAAGVLVGILRLHRRTLACASDGRPSRFWNPVGEQVVPLTKRFGRTQRRREPEPSAKEE